MAKMTDHEVSIYNEGYRNGLQHAQQEADRDSFLCPKCGYTYSLGDHEIDSLVCQVGQDFKGNKPPENWQDDPDTGEI